MKIPALDIFEKTKQERTGDFHTQFYYHADTGLFFTVWYHRERKFISQHGTVYLKTYLLPLSSSMLTNSVAFSPQANYTGWATANIMLTMTFVIKKSLFPYSESTKSGMSVRTYIKLYLYRIKN
jgi:hypothetical protein